MDNIYTFKVDTVLPNKSCNHLVKKGAKAKIIDELDDVQVLIVLINDPFKEIIAINKNVLA